MSCRSRRKRRSGILNLWFRSPFASRLRQTWMSSKRQQRPRKCEAYILMTWSWAVSPATEKKTSDARKRAIQRRLAGFKRELLSVARIFRLCSRSFAHVSRISSAIIFARLVAKGSKSHREHVTAHHGPIPAMTNRTPGRVGIKPFVTPFGE